MGPLSYLLIVGCILLETTEQVFYRLAGRRKRMGYVAFVAPGVAAHVSRMGLWYLLLSTTPLVVALPLMGANYLAVALAGRVLFKETIDRRRWLGTALIVAGIALVGLHGWVA